MMMNYSNIRSGDAGLKTSFSLREDEFLDYYSTATTRLFRDLCAFLAADL